MQTYNSFNEMAGTTGSLEGAGVDFQTLLERTGGSTGIRIEPTWNLALVASFRGVRGCRSGLGLYVTGLDHGNPHVEAKANGKTLAKIFIEPAVVFDPSQNVFLDKNEKNAVLEFLQNKENLAKCMAEWNRIHKDNTSAQAANIPVEE